MARGDGPISLSLSLYFVHKNAHRESKKRRYNGGERTQEVDINDDEGYSSLRRLGKENGQFTMDRL